jgi:[ribosomal protein S5]-alanine N-acetyltransferase
MNLAAIERDGTVSGFTGTAPDAARSAIQATVRLYSRVGWMHPWIGYLALEDNVCVGTCAFTSAPRENIVEVAYCTFPGHEGRGCATRMAASLVSMARGFSPGVVVTAHTLPEEGASTRVLRKVGFVLVGPRLHEDDGQIWVWRYLEPFPQHDQSPDPTPGSVTPAAGQQPGHP